ncbi:hypothetical protein BT96DRAFT_1002902 [Gymnopus androsaceus JB14]|uniref:RING-type domain-containing protein n=1 Tax=Gymnopus androsaceus JB14 TaxID=1447944 RepID=A0A6A4GXI7_9AGAR|nr:hypothetical protein BT96DRAFT_1002902 [Gymnopus androsaceus JB14]
MLSSPTHTASFPLSIRRRPSRTRSLPIQSHLASISEDSEHDEVQLRVNAGTESSVESTPQSGTSGVSSLPGAAEEHAVLSQDSTQSKLKLVPRQKQKGRLKIQTSINSDRDCGICFDLAVRPSRTKCCRNIFCEDHLSDWLSGSSNLCPSCTEPCHPKTGIISLASPVSPTAHHILPPIPFAPPSSPLHALFPISLTPTSDPGPEWPPSSSSLQWDSSSRWEDESPASASSERSYFSFEPLSEPREPSPFPIFSPNRRLSFENVDPEMFTQSLTNLAGKMAGRVLNMIGLVLVLHVLLGQSSFYTN